jgi:hypothetical protein
MRALHVVFFTILLQMAGELFSSREFLLAVVTANRVLLTHPIMFLQAVQRDITIAVLTLAEPFWTIRQHMTFQVSILEESPTAQTALDLLVWTALPVCLHISQFSSPATGLLSRAVHLQRLDIPQTSFVISNLICKECVFLVHQA